MVKDYKTHCKGTIKQLYLPNTVSVSLCLYTVSKIFKKKWAGKQFTKRDMGWGSYRTWTNILQIGSGSVVACYMLSETCNEKILCYILVRSGKERK